MSFKVVILFEAIISTGEHMLDVNFTMHSQISTLCEFLITNRTGERLFTGVNSTMRIQVASSSVFLITIRADERLFTRVYSTMHNQIMIMFELLVTIRTVKRLLTSVNSTMLFQNAIMFEPLMTISTDVDSRRYFVWTSCHNLDRRTSYNRETFSPDDDD